MKMTLLEMVQDILSSMDSDEVNSISDTVESMQVAKIIRNSYIDIIDRVEMPEQYSLFELDATSGDTQTMMTLPSDVSSIEWIKYDSRDSTETIPEYVDIKPMTLPDFLDFTYRYDTDADGFFSYDYTINGDTVTIFGYNDKHPQWYTVLEDDTILFDSYDATVDAFLQKNKTLAFGKIVPTFSFTDNYIPRLDPNQFGLLLNEAKREAFVELKQTQNIVSEQRAKRGWIRAQRNKEGLPTQTQYSKYPNYGRK